MDRSGGGEKDVAYRDAFSLGGPFHFSVLVFFIIIIIIFFFSKFSQNIYSRFNFQARTNFRKHSGRF